MFKDVLTKPLTDLVMNNCPCTKVSELKIMNILRNKFRFFPQKMMIFDHTCRRNTNIDKKNIPSKLVKSFCKFKRVTNVLELFFESTLSQYEILIMFLSYANKRSEKRITHLKFDSK